MKKILKIYHPTCIKTKIQATKVKIDLGVHAKIMTSSITWISNLTIQGEKYNSASYHRPEGLKELQEKHDVIQGPAILETDRFEYDGAFGTFGLAGIGGDITIYAE